MIIAWFKRYWIYRAMVCVNVNFEGSVLSPASNFQEDYLSPVFGFTQSELMKVNSDREKISTALNSHCLANFRFDGSWGLHQCGKR